MAETRDSLRLSDMFNPDRNLFWYLIGALALAIGGNFASDLLREWIGNSVYLRLLIFGICFVATAPAAIAIRKSWKRLRESRAIRYFFIPSPAFRGSSVEVEGRVGLIVFVSERDSHVTSIQHHLRKGTLQRCWLLHTDRTAKQAREYAKTMNANTVGVRFTARESLEYIPDSGIDDLPQTYELFCRVLDHALAEVGRDGVIVDVTGGNAIVTAGAIYACIEKNVSAEYISRSTNAIIPVNVTWRAVAEDATPIVIDDEPLAEHATNAEVSQH